MLALLENTPLWLSFMSIKSGICISIVSNHHLFIQYHSNAMSSDNPTPSNNAEPIEPATSNAGNATSTRTTSIASFKFCNKSSTLLLKLIDDKIPPHPRHPSPQWKRVKIRSMEKVRLSVFLILTL